jgi:hypothetical protein
MRYKTPLVIDLRSYRISFSAGYYDFLIDFDLKRKINRPMGAVSVPFSRFITYMYYRRESNHKLILLFDKLELTSRILGEL